MRRFLACWLALMGAVAALLLAMPDTSARRLHFGGGQVGLPPWTTMTFGAATKYGTGGCPGSPVGTKCVSGDTWFNTWGSDGKIYTASCDSSVWSAPSSCGNFPCQTSNVMASTLSDYSSTSTGTQVNPMTMWNGGTNPDCAACNWKQSGLISVHGTLVMSVIRQNNNDNFPLGLYVSAQLITSTDHGTSWTPIPPTTGGPYASPMFTDPKFRAPMFFQYPNQDYTGQTADGSDQWVYALSPDQTVNSNSHYLGRVAVADVTYTADASKWTYYQGGGNWGALATAAPVFSVPDFPSGVPLNMSGAPMYLPAFGTYFVMPSWDTSGTTITQWDIFQAPHPWGPWTKSQQNTWNTGGTGPGFYLPAPVPSSVVPDGGRTFTLLTAGDYTQQYAYTMYTMPVTVQ